MTTYAHSQSYNKMNGVPSPLVDALWQAVSGWMNAHTHNRIVFIFANVALGKLSHANYSHETRDTK
jgi:hypothetical protein